MAGSRRVKSGVGRVLKNSFVLVSAGDECGDRFSAEKVL